MSRRLTMISSSLLAGVAAAGAVAALIPATAAADLPAGKVQIVSAGALAFGPPGILFVGDSLGASIVAIDTGDTKAPTSPVKINVDGLGAKIAALVGVAPDQIVINDLKVNPISKNVYVSASRGRGPDAMPLIMRVDGAGNVTNVSLDNAKSASVSLVDAPVAQPAARNNPRMQTITDIEYVNGNLLVAGLSNEEWSSALRSIPYPFKTADQGATLQIWHSSHGRFETAAPVRTFVPYTIAGTKYVLAAYTCTPLVKIPVSDLKPGAQIKGVEIADLGAGNQPLDMVPYAKGGHNFILIANSSFGVVKLKADNLDTYPAIVSPTVTDVAGVPYDKIAGLPNVTQLAQIDDSDVVLLSGSDLKTIALP